MNQLSFEICDQFVGQSLRFLIDLDTVEFGSQIGLGQGMTKAAEDVVAPDLPDKQAHFGIVLDYFLIEGEDFIGIVQGLIFIGFVDGQDLNSKYSIGGQLIIV